jgi:hypothetical protein
MSLLRLSNLRMDYEPYPVGTISPAFEPGLYRELLSAFPPLDLFKFSPAHGNKYSLSEKNHPRRYRDFVSRHRVWREFHRYVKSDEFIHSVIDALRDRKVDLGIRRRSQLLAARWLVLARHVVRGQLPVSRPPIRSRFEFSALPANAGYVVPHTDSPGKLITLVATMTDDREWDARWGGGTDILKPKDPSDSYNYFNRQVSHEQCEVLRTVAFLPNQAMLFIKTFNSLHGVRPMNGPETALRRTLTINIEQGS